MEFEEAMMARAAAQGNERAREWLVELDERTHRRTTVIAVARRYHFQAQHHLPGIKGYEEPHWHEYTIEIRCMSGTDEKFLDTAQLDEWWAEQPSHDHADLNKIYASTTVEEIASVLLHNAMKVIGPEVVSVTVWEDDDRWGRAA